MVVASTVCDQVDTDRRTSCALSIDGDLVRITYRLSAHQFALKDAVFQNTSKRLDVLLNPVQGQALVSETKVEMAGIGNLFAATQETPWAETVVDGNANNGLANFYRVLYREGEVVALVNTASFEEPTAVDPECYREFVLLSVSCRADDVDVKTIFRDLEQ